MQGWASGKCAMSPRKCARWLAEGADWCHIIYVPWPQSTGSLSSCDLKGPDFSKKQDSN